jgi:hypothetical protein
METDRLTRLTSGDFDSHAALRRFGLNRFSAFERRRSRFNADARLPAFALIFA